MPIIQGPAVLGQQEVETRALQFGQTALERVDVDLLPAKRTELSSQWPPHMASAAATAWAPMSRAAACGSAGPTLRGKLE